MITVVSSRRALFPFLLLCWLVVKSTILVKTEEAGTEYKTFEFVVLFSLCFLGVRGGGGQSLFGENQKMIKIFRCGGFPEVQNRERTESGLNMCVNVFFAPTRSYCVFRDTLVNVPCAVTIAPMTVCWVALAACPCIVCATTHK